MVPFGSAAFFPGRLIHTNEQLVLIREGYCAERTARQTVEILERRGMGLEAQVETLKGMALDLEAEARFFETIAAEGAEGLVEIREEYIGEPQNVGPESAYCRHQLLVCLKPASPDSRDYLFTGSRDGTLRRRALAEAICSATFESHVD